MSDTVSKEMEYELAKNYFRELKFISLTFCNWPFYKRGGTLMIKGWNRIIGIDVHEKLFKPPLQEVDKIIEILARNGANKWKKTYKLPGIHCDVPTWDMCFYMENKKPLCISGDEGAYPKGFKQLRKLLFPDSYKCKSDIEEILWEENKDKQFQTGDEKNKDN